MQNRMEPLRCGECAAQVLVQKNSWEHTSIQWNTDARRRCPVVQDDDGRDGRPGAPWMSCSHLDARSPSGCFRGHRGLRRHSDPSPIVQ